MNRYTIILTLLAFCTLHCAGQSNVVYYGANSNALDVVFVDKNLSAKTKSDIVADLNLCLSEWGKKGEVRLWDDEDTAGYFYVGTSCPHYPDEIEFPENVVSNGTAGIALQIPKELSDAYTKAFAEFVSSTNFANLPPQKLPDYFLHNKETPKEVIARAQEIISELGEQTYYSPSVLGFSRISRGPGIFSNSNLWMLLPESSPLSYSDEKGWGNFPAIWHKGKWKFCFWDEDE